VNLATRDVGLIAWRSVRRTMRQPANIVAPLTFPILLLAINSSGLQGIFVLIVLALTIGAAWGSVGIWIALRTGSGEAVQSQFPILFFFIIISSMNLPRNLIEADWFRTAATLNPVSYMIEGLRSLIIEGWNAQALALGFGFGILAGIVAMSLAAVELRKQMART
jgi:ABC-2 type transport system permease protein